MDATSFNNEWATSRFLRIIGPAMGRSRKNTDRLVNVARRLRILKRAFYGPDASDAAFAKFAGLTAANWSNYSKPLPEALISTEAMYKLAAATGVTFDYVYRGLLAGVPLDLAEKIREAEREMPD